MAELIKIKIDGTFREVEVLRKAYGVFSPVQLLPEVPPPAVGENFVVYNKVDFEANTLGAYNLTEWRANWNNPGSPWTSLANLQIVNQQGRKCLRHNYLSGQYGANGGGCNFNGIIPNSSGLTELYFSYRIFFESGFHWGQGGKMSGLRNVPGPSGGTGLDYKNTDGFSARLMWNSTGTIRFYNYHHSMGATYGHNMGLANWGQLIPGQWHTITQRYVMNTVGSVNGICQCWLDGDLVATAQNMEFRKAASPQQITEIYMCTFMGGNDSSWAPNHNQHILTDDFHVWRYSPEYLAANPSVARGLVAHSSGHTLLTPLG